MKYSFDEITDRSGTHSIKYDIIPEDQRKEMLSLWVADMDFSCAEPILSALQERTGRRIFGYTSYDNPENKAAVTGWFHRRHHWDIPAEDIFFSHGVVAAFSVLINILSTPGDGIVIQPPVYYPFRSKIEANGRKAVNNPLLLKGGHYEIDFEDLDLKMSDPHNKGLLFCSPHNPIGRLWTEEELKRIAAVCRRYDKWIIADEIHCDLLRIGAEHHPMLKVCSDYADRIIACTAPTKTFNMAGLGISNIIIPNKEYQSLWRHFACERLSLEDCSPLSLAAQEAAYNHCEDWLDALRIYLDGNIDFTEQYLKETLPKARMIHPDATYLVWIDFRAYCSDPAALEQLMRRKARVMLDEGYIFGEGGEGFERINIATPRSILSECLARIASALNGNNC